LSEQDQRRRSRFVHSGIGRLAPGLIAVAAIGCLLYDRAQTRAELHEVHTKLNQMADAGRPAQQRPRARTWTEVATDTGDSSVFSARPSEAGVATRDDASPKSHGPEDRSQRNQEYWEKQRQHLEGMFTAETRDRGWASGTEVTLTNKIQPLLPQQSTLQELRCASTFCRVQFSHQDSEAYRTFLKTVFPPGNAVSRTEITISNRPQPDGSQKTTVFIAREGQALPIDRTLRP
jgi:hypothetical protein